MKTYLTLDVGGSAIKYALMQEDLTILEKSSVPTPMDTLENFIETIGKIYDQFQDQINGMALSMPGIIDPERGYQYTGGALRYIDKLETVEVLKKRCPTNITIGNDAKCAANAEIGFGNLQDIQDGAVVILGTGIGGCLIKDHKVHTGKHFSAGEFCIICFCNDPRLVLYRKTDVFLSGRTPVFWRRCRIFLYDSLSSGGLAGLCLPFGSGLDCVGPGQLPDGIPESSDTVASGRESALPGDKPESFLISVFSRLEAP